MRKYFIILYLLIFSLPIEAIETIEGSMNCKISESSVINIEEGRAKGFSGVEGKVNKSDTFKFSYRYAEYNTQTMFFMFEPTPKKRLFVFDAISFDLDELSYFSPKDNLALFNDNLKTRALSFSPNYIRILTEHGEEIRLKRYYKGDWHGTYNHFEDLMVESHFFDCKANSDRVMDVIAKLKTLALTVGKSVN